MLTYRSAAKINLFLSVRGRLPRGYHELTSVMQSVSLYDTLTFDFGRRNFSLSVPGFNLGAVEDNIVTRIWRLMAERFNLQGQVAVTIDKKIPVGAGLAGGSGNGAAMLHAVNRHFSLGLSLAELASIGGEVGSDIPFCVVGGTALTKGRGEKLEKLPPLPDCAIILANGGFHVSTKEIFSAFDDLPLLDRSEAPLLESLSLGDPVKIGQCLYNDLERVTLCRYPSLAQIKQAWEGRGLYALMSGSGPTIFALAPHYAPVEAQKALDDIQAKGFVVYPVTESVALIDGN